MVVIEYMVTFCLLFMVNDIFNIKVGALKNKWIFPVLFKTLANINRCEQNNRLFERNITIAISIYNLSYITLL